MDTQELKHQLRSKPGFNYDHQSDYLIDQATHLVRIRIEEPMFRTLIAATWVFEEGESPRTIESLVKKLRERNLTWATVPDDLRYHGADWYTRVDSIYRQFDWARFGPLFVMPIKGARCDGREDPGTELSGSPSASLMIANGIHGALAAMTLVEEGRRFRELDAILLLPRIDYPR